MGNYQLIQGKLSHIELTASKNTVLKNAGSQAATSALIGAVTGSTSASTAAPMLLMLNKEFDVYTIKAKIENRKIVGQFSYIGELQDKDVIVVLDKEKSKCYQFIYALIEPQSGLIYMADELGQSLKWLRISYLKWFLIFYLITICLAIIVSVIAVIAVTSFLDFNLLLKGLGIISGFLFIFIAIVCLFSGYTPYIKFSKMSEEIFELLGFENPKDINLYKVEYKNKEGKKYEGIYEYRKVIKIDPYPKNYFEKLKNDTDA